MKKRVTNILFISITIMIILYIMMYSYYSSNESVGDSNQTYEINSTVVQSFNQKDDNEVENSSQSISTEFTPVSTEYKATLTPFPTLQKTSQINEIRNYLENNGKCNFPCWWGIHVGRTSWINTTQNFNAIFPKKVIGTYDLQIDDHLYQGEVNTYFFVLDENDIYLDLYEYSNEIVYIIFITDFTDIYSIDAFISDLGIPDHIYIYTEAYTEGYPLIVKYLPFHITLHYEKDNLVLWYDMRAQNDGNTIRSCLHDMQNINVSIWSEKYGELKVEDYALGTAAGGYQGPYQLVELEEVTDLNIESFIRLFTNDPDACIETPAEYW